MEDLKKYFPKSGMTTLQIREAMINILKVDPFIPFFCYRCFKHVSLKDVCCDVCFQPYCKDCLVYLVGPGSGKSGIDPDKCLQCIENRIQE